MFTGPNISGVGNLVLDLDAGNIKSFLGEPTTNLVPSPYAYLTYAYVSGPVDTITFNENYTLVSVKRYTVTQTVNTARAAIFPVNLTTGTTYAFSFKCKYNGTTTTQPIFLVNSEKGNPEKDNSNTNLTNNPIIYSIGNNWNYFTYTFSFSSCPTSACILTFGLYTAAVTGYTNETFDIYQAQFEIKNYCTPYVNGSRLASNGWLDLSGNNNNGTLSGVTYNNDQVGSLVFDGVSNYVDLGSTTILNNLDNYLTVEAWVKTRTNSGTQMIAGRANDWRVQKNGTSYQFEHRNSSQNIVVASSTNTSTDWLYIVATYSLNTFVKIFINGIEMDSQAQTLSTRLSQTQNQIGNNYAWHSGSTYNDYWFNGLISNVKIYNRALSASEILQNYNGLRFRYQERIVTSGLTLFLDAARQSSYPAPYNGTVWYDISSSGSTATLYNAPTYSNGNLTFVDSSSQYAKITSFANPTQFTISVWIYSLEDGREQHFAEFGLTQFYKSSSNKLGTPAWSSVYGNTTILTGIWYHVVCVRNLSSVTLYVNGVLDSGLGTIGTDPLNTFYIANYYGETGSFKFHGMINKLCVYNRALNQAEITQNFNADRSRFGI